MSLDEYWQKRDFERTPEPHGARPPDGDEGPLRRFVVQRHRARRLHYDFRLEIDGVLLSWAVPRGPSMRPLEKRMAARTEDHPIEYIDFEGVIPGSQYGAGDVIVWDHGHWEPESDVDPARAVEAGELKFAVHGERLRGRFVIVRTRRGDARKEDWLLIHKRDEHAEAAWDIDDYPTSVLTGRTNEDVAAGRAPTRTPPARGIADIDLDAAADAPLPRFVKPMLATAVDRAFSDDGWLYELKLDGYRVQAVVGGRALRLWTRNRVDAATYFPAFAAAPPDWIDAREAVVDGEMVALDEHGRPDFSLLQDLSGLKGLAAARGERAAREDPRPPRTGTLVFHAFDLLHFDGRSLIRVPLEQRKRLLQLILAEHPDVRYVSHVLGQGEDFQSAVVAQGLEGSMAKLRQSPYEPGVRSRAWLKVKARREQELVLVGYEPGRGSHQELGSLLVATHEAGSWRFAGQVGSGIDAPTRKLLRRMLDEHPLPKPPVRDAPRLDGARWSEPRHVIRAEFTEWTSDDLLRQASYKGLELGRDPTSVSHESAVPAPSTSGSARARGDDRRNGPTGTRAVGGAGGTGEAPEATSMPGLVRRPGAVGDPAEAVTRVELDALDSMGAAGRWAVGGHEVALTNLDKVLFPEPGFTKRDLVRYYTTMAPTILPYLRERPLNVHRWPDGVEGRTNFWQKQIPAHAPEWVARWDYPEAGREQSHTYVVADRVATMAWLANQAVIDLHPWTSRLPEYWRPTYAYVDIDPGENTTWDEVLTLARLYRTALGHLGVRAFPKVTGKRGIQIWIHVLPRYTFEDTRDWVGSLSRGVGAVVPELVSWEWGVRDRGGLARLDYTQNSLIKTLVAPYAVRPVATASVSMPIEWEELDDPALRPGRWDLRSAVERVESTGDRFRGVLDDPQELPPLS